MTQTTKWALGALLALAAGPVTAAQAAAPPAGATWSSTYLETADGESLHADVLRPVGATDATKTPTILVVSPYLGDAGSPGPVNRFYDFYEGAKLFERGYSVVQVSTRGTGGSTGCLDVLGPGEQEDVRAGVRFVESQPWSTGKVGMYGKSYDANLGLAGAAIEAPGLDAVVAQQVGVDRYRGSHNGKVRLAQSLLYPALYGSGGERGWGLGSDDQYTLNAAMRSGDCQAFLAPHYVDDPSIDFWKARDFDDIADGSQVPVLMTGGYLDNATNIGGGHVEYFQNIDGPKRMWIGWWDHVRGNDLSGGELAMGRAGWFDEVMRFYDHFLKGEDTGWQSDPVIAAQTSDGTWHEETAWPPADAQPLVQELEAGTYPDDAKNAGERDGSLGAGGLVSPPGTGVGRGAWTVGAPLAERTQVAGVPSATVTLAGVPAPRTNVVVNVYDIDPDGNATYVTRGAALYEGAGAGAITLPLWPTDWVFEAGHRIGYLVSGSNVDNYVHVPTNTTVTVSGGSVTLPKLPAPRGATTDGGSNPRLQGFRERAPFPVPASAL